MCQLHPSKGSIKRANFSVFLFHLDGTSKILVLYKQYPVLHKQKNGTTWWAVNYCELEKFTLPEAYSTLCLSQVVDSLTGSKVFSCWSYLKADQLACSFTSKGGANQRIWGDIQATLSFRPISRFDWSHWMWATSEWSMWVRRLWAREMWTVYKSFETISRVDTS